MFCYSMSHWQEGGRFAMFLADFNKAIYTDIQLCQLYSCFYCILSNFRSISPFPLKQSLQCETADLGREGKQQLNDFLHIETHCGCSNCTFPFMLN